MSETIALGIAVYAAVVSTFVGIWTAYGIYRDRASIKVEVKFGYVTTSINGSWVTNSPKYDPARVDESTLLVIRAINVGRRLVTLDAGGLLCKDKTLSMFTGHGAFNTYPIKLGEGESGSTFAYLSTRRDPLNPPIKAAFRSETGKIYTTNLSKEVLKVLMDQ